MKKIVIIVLILAILLSVIVYFVITSLGRRPTDSNQQITLNFYGLWEQPDLIQPAIDLYQQQNPNVKINYVFQSSRNYRSRVQAKLSAKQEGKPEEAPDVFMIHNTWLPMFTKLNMVSEMPNSVMSVDEYNKTFYPIAKDSFVKNNKAYAMPIAVDGLALFYNEDLFAEAGLNPPKDWNEFISTAVRLTKKDEQGRIIQSGAAIGATGNVHHWSDIVGLLFKQESGANLEKPNDQFGANVVNFYTSFVTKKDRQVWDLSMGPSTDVFAAGQVAMYFGPSWRIQEIREKNPQLKFKTVPVPQLPGKNVGWGTFWALSVASSSMNQVEAWKFLKFLTSAETEQLLYTTAAQKRLIGQPYSRVDLKSKLEQDPQAGSFVTQGPSYQSWYLASMTHDQDLNDNIIKYYEDALNSVLNGSDAQGALGTTAKGIEQVLGNLQKTTPAQ